jgi:hypothetical protein
MSHEAGKGDNTRPFSVPLDVYYSNFDRIFKKEQYVENQADAPKRDNSDTGELSQSQK